MSEFDRAFLAGVVAGGPIWLLAAFAVLVGLYSLGEYFAARAERAEYERIRSRRP